MKEKVKVRAHGRVNLIGEHTDYNGGWVLPTSIPQYTEVELTQIEGNEILLESDGRRSYKYILGEEKKSETWADYLQGATKILSEMYGINKLSGFKAHISSTIPEGSGLSSSAALEMSFLKALRESFALEINDLDLARIGQKIENEFVGARVGIMDQMATSLAQYGEALFLDTLTLKFERIPIPLDEIDLIVINSGISHRLSASDGGYNQRRSECEEVCRLLTIPSLREATLQDLEKHELPLHLYKRARHVITENGRVFEAVEALRSKNYVELGRLFIASHESMKNDYEVSLPEIDLLVNITQEQEGVYGARLTGGGFGGSIVAISEKGKKNTIAEKVILSYNEKTREKARLLT